MAAYEALLANIGLFLEQRQSGAQEEKLPALSAEELREQVGAALTELENFRSQECASLVEAVMRHALPEEAADSLAEIQRQLKLFEDDQAEALFHTLLCKLEKEEGENE